jgi:hypothetical protein
MRNFRPRDKVRCISTAGAGLILKLDKIYTVEQRYVNQDTQQPYVRLEGLGDAGWRCSRFELVEE